MSESPGPSLGGDPPRAARARAGSRPSAAPERPRRRLASHFIAVLLGASAVAYLVGGMPATVSAALGVMLAGANLLLMQKITAAMTAGVGAADSGETSPGGSAAWGLLLPFKLVALVGVAYALVTFRVAQPVPLAMGFALLPLTGVFLPRPSSVPDLVTPQPRRRRASVRP